MSAAVRAVAPRALVVGVALAVCACASARTQILVVTDTDLRGPGGIDTIFATVTGPTGDTQMSVARIGPGEPALPRTLGLVHDGARLGPYTVRLTGNTGGALRVTRVARVWLQEQRTLVLRMDLLARCESVACGGEQTCGEGGCRSIDVAPEELTEWHGSVPSLAIDASTPIADAGVPDDAPPPDTGSCTPTTETCNLADDDCDGMVDETFSLDTDELNCGGCGVRCSGPDRACCAGTCGRDCL